MHEFSVGQAGGSPIFVEFSPTPITKSPVLEQGATIKVGERGATEVGVLIPDIIKKRNQRYQERFFKIHASDKEFASASKMAVDRAMQNIRDIAQKISKTIDSLVEKPSEVEVSFGVRFDAESSAVIAKAGIDASLNVKLKWQRDQASDKEPEK